MNEKNKFKEQLEKEYKVKEDAMNAKLNAKVAEVAQLKSIQ